MTTVERALHPADAGLSASRRWVLFALVALCALPPVIATTLYRAGWRPVHAVNHGVLIQPPPALPDISLNTVDGTAAPLRSGRWLLIYTAPPGRPAASRDMLRKLQRLRLALGPQGERLQGLLMLPNQAQAQAVRAQPHAGVLVVRTTPAERAALAAAFGAGQESPWSGDYIYLADPLGNLIMRYPLDVTPGNVLADLKRLMTYSWVG